MHNLLLNLFWAVMQPESIFGLYGGNVMQTFIYALIYFAQLIEPA